MNHPAHSNCSLCRGNGYIVDVSQKCMRCKGSGDESNGYTPLARLWGEIERLQKDINDGVTRQAQRIARGITDDAPRRPSFARCPGCKGNGFTTDRPAFHDISKCRSCNGTGTTGMALPVIERLWYEIDRLKREMERRIADAVKNYQTAPPEVINEDLCLHILGLAEGADREAVKKAYKQKATESHPDSGGSDLAFRAVRAAYDHLMEGSP
jgi:DnaJ-class molecular chaperone